MEPSSPLSSDGLVALYRRARQDPQQVLLEGFHAVKHALRFGAILEHAAAWAPDEVLQLAERLAPDLRSSLEARLQRVSEHEYRQLAPTPPRTGVLAIARRPTVDAAALLDGPAARPLVLLDHPSDPGNVGAVIRVAAGAGAGGVLCLGPRDPYDPVAVRGAAGLHFALPVAGLAELPPSSRPLIAADPGGEELAPDALPADAVLAFGTEREGLRPALLRRADRRLRIPMRPGVSSLNLATSVAVFLYAWRLGAGGEAAGRSP